MTEAPERIWVDPDIKFPECEKQYGCDVEYIRKDRHDALLKQVREDALREAADACCHPTNVESGGESAICRNRVLALIEKDKTNG